ncbi:uncharacterized protein LOC119271970 [Triticum dicoccoides]|uniref:uncharacterized protein LOC119271970 n=1 Tax=Triticum dicoccoides TaxID=85692 RepID=UPI0018908D87|nr:uncharacterized protein LOC119271970 [Triticum dicoccoides]
MSSTTQSAGVSAKCAAWAQERRPFTHPIEIPAASGAPDERRGRGEEEDGGEVEPPHVLMARRRAASSVCSGQGRTLKGRDLTRTRDSVLRMTGFIES